MGDASDTKRGRGRPRKWANNAERMRTNRARLAAELAAFRAGGPYIEMAEQIVELTRQRDTNWDQVLRLQKQIKTLQRDQPARRSRTSRPEFDDPDAAAEAHFDAVNNARQSDIDHAECAAEIDRLRHELIESGRQRAQLKEIVQRFQKRNTDLANGHVAATTTLPSAASSPAQPAMPRPRRRQAEREAKRQKRRP